MSTAEDAKAARLARLEAAKLVRLAELEKLALIDAALHEVLGSGKLALFHVEREVKHPHFRFRKDVDGSTTPYWRRSKVVRDTIAVLINDDGTYTVGVSYQSPEDNYNRKEGNRKAFQKATGDYDKVEHPTWDGPVPAETVDELQDVVKALLTGVYRSKTLAVQGVRGYSFEDTIDWIGKVVKGEHRKPKE